MVAGSDLRVSKGLFFSQKTVVFPSHSERTFLFQGNNPSLSSCLKISGEENRFGAITVQNFLGTQPCLATQDGSEKFLGNFFLCWEGGEV